MKNLLALQFGAPACLSSLAIVAGLSIYPDFLLALRCGCIAPLESKTVFREKLLTCTSVVQHIDWEHSSNIVRSPGDVDGWEVFSPADPKLPARLSVVAVRNRNEAIWYPRLSGKDATIDLLNDDNGYLRLMDHVVGKETWNSIGSQRVLDFNCLSYGYLKDKDVPERLVFQLKGQWTQIWAWKGAVLF